MKSVLLTEKIEVIICQIIRSPGCRNLISDKTALKILYKLRFHRKLNLDNPKTFNEKLLWLTLNDRKSDYTIMVDKYRVKKYIDSKIGKGYTVPVFGCWTNTADIQFEELPNDYVLKCNHDSGSVIICKGRNPSTQELKKLNRALKKNYFWFSREWPYKNVEPVIFAEKYIEDSCAISDAGICDYKIYCFNGTPKIVCIISERGTGAKLTFLDLNWRKLCLKQRYPNHDVLPKRPQRLECMIEIATKLSKNIPFLRVDFFEDLEKNIYVGELTFTPSSGLIPFENEKEDLYLGELLSI